MGWNAYSYSVGETIDYRGMSRRKLASLLSHQDVTIWVYLRGSNRGHSFLVPHGEIRRRAALGSWVGCMKFAHKFSFCSCGICQLGGRENGISYVILSDSVFIEILGS